MHNPMKDGAWTIGIYLHDAGEQARVEKRLLGFLFGEKYAEVEYVPAMGVRWTEPVVLMKKGAPVVTPIGSAL